MSEVLELVLTWIGLFAVSMFLLFLIEASVFGCFRKRDRRKEGKVQKRKRLSVQIGQQLEVEYSILPETSQYAADAKVERIFAYSGAVRVDVTKMVHCMTATTFEKITELCRKAEGLTPAIPF